MLTLDFNFQNSNALHLIKITKFKYGSYSAMVLSVQQRECCTTNYAYIRRVVVHPHNTVCPIRLVKLLTHFIQQQKKFLKNINKQNKVKKKKNCKDCHTILPLSIYKSYQDKQSTSS